MTDCSPDNSCCCWTAQPSCQHHKDVDTTDLPWRRWVWIKPTAIQLLWLCWWRTPTMHFARIRYLTWKILSRTCVEHRLTEMVRAACQKELRMSFQALPTLKTSLKCFVCCSCQSSQENMLAAGMGCAGRFGVRLRDCRWNHRWPDQKVGWKKHSVHSLKR